MGAAVEGLGTLGQCVADRMRVRVISRATVRLVDGSEVQAGGNIRFITVARLVDDGRAAEVLGYNDKDKLVWTWKRGDPLDDAQDDGETAQDAPGLAMAPVVPIRAQAAPSAPAGTNWAALDALDVLQAKAEVRMMAALRAGAEIVTAQADKVVDQLLGHVKSLQTTVQAQQKVIDRQTAEIQELRAELAGRPVVVQEIDNTPDQPQGLFSSELTETIGQVAGAALAQLGASVTERKGE